MGLLAAAAGVDLGENFAIAAPCPQSCGQQLLWADHDEFARRLLREPGGREIDKTDGFLLLFASRHRR